MLHILIVLELLVFSFHSLLSWVGAALVEQPHPLLVPTRAFSWEGNPSWSREWSHVATPMSQLGVPTRVVLALAQREQQTQHPTRL